MFTAIRDRIASLAMKVSRRAATPGGWSDIRRRQGAPNILAGLHMLRERGFRPQAVIDGGANVGQWTQQFKSVFPEAAVLMVEPQARHEAVLREVSASFAPAVQCAITLIGPANVADQAFVVMDDDSHGAGSSVLNEDSDIPRHVVRMPMRTLDTVIAEHGFPAPDFIKLDVQGYELQVLAGATQALATAECVLLEVAVWPYNEGSPLMTDVLVWMDGRGFRPYEIFELMRRPDGVLVQVDLLFIRKTSDFVRETTTRYRGRG